MVPTVHLTVNVSFSVYTQDVSDVSLPAMLVEPLSALGIETYTRGPLFCIVYDFYMYVFLDISIRYIWYMRTSPHFKHIRTVIKEKVLLRIDVFLDECFSVVLCILQTSIDSITFNGSYTFH